MRKANASQLSSLSLLALAILHWQIGTITAESICGQRPIAAPGTITYGQSSWPGQFPWHVALYRTEQPHLSITYACGGFIVGERVILTAAHCVTAPSGYQIAANELAVRVGLYDLLTLARHSQEHRVGQIHRHGNFTVGSPRHDLALLTLRTVVEFGDFVQPICLPREGKNTVQGVRHGIVSGWGLTEDDVPARSLRSAAMPIVSYIQCLESDSALFGPILYSGMFCAGWENGTNVCNGDSGGAFVANINGSWTALGVVSFTGVGEDIEDQIPFRCNTKSLAGFISIEKYIDWIESVATLEAVQLARTVDQHLSTSKTQLQRISDRSIIHVFKSPPETVNRIPEIFLPSVCQSYRERCPAPEDVSYLASVCRPVHVSGTPSRYARLVIDCYGVLISERFLLAPASCYHSTALTKQFIMLEFAGQATAYNIKTFHQHPNFINNRHHPSAEHRADDERERKQRSNLALIELERTVPLSTCQFVCLWSGGESDTLPAIVLYSAVNVSSGDKSIESSEVTAWANGPSQGSRCYDELLAPMVMLQELDGAPSDRLVGIVLERTCAKIRFIKVAPFLDWIEQIVWRDLSSENDNRL